MEKARNLLSKALKIFKTEKTGMAAQAAGQMREIGRLGQTLVIMELGR